MIRQETLAVSRETFAAGRQDILTDAEDTLRPHIKEALTRVGLGSWEQQIVAAALGVFDLTARENTEGGSQSLDDLRDMFAQELGETLEKTTKTDTAEKQLNTLTRWVAMMAHNAAMEAATSSDPDGNVGLEWVAMGDGDVRDSHRAADGQQVPTGSPFTVDDVELMYPGQPKGDPSVWLNCRCVARPTMLGEMAAQTVAASVSRETLAAGIKAAYPEATNPELYSTDVSRETFAGAPGLKKDGTPPVCKFCTEPSTGYVLHSEGMAYVPFCATHEGEAKAAASESTPGGPPDPGNIDRVAAYALTEADVSRETETKENPMEDNSGPSTSSVIVALPEAADPLSTASSEKDGAHCTLLWFGDAAALDELALKEAIQQFIDHGQVTPITDTVSGRATLGKDKADVVLLDTPNLLAIRSGLLEQNTLLQANESVDQHPTWLPHVTLGYPSTPAAGEYTAEPGTPVTFDRLALWHGESRTEFPLGGPAPTPEKEVIHPEDAGFTQQMADEVFASLVAAGAAPERIEPDVSRETDSDVSRETLRPWHGVLAPEGADSGDGRGFAERVLTMRDLPLPLKAQFIDDEGHKGSVVVGRIDVIQRDGGLIRASGVWDDSPDADRAWALIEKKMWRGVSVDLDAAEGEVVEASDGGQGSVVFSQGRVCSATLCAIPAFAEAFVRNGTWEEFADLPLPTGEMVEIPDWAAVSLVASAAPDVISADYFRNPELDGPTPVTRGADGHIFGHLAEWGTCHIAYEVCTTVPPSSTEYAYFLTGQVFTDVGPVAVGQLTVGGGHADPKLGVRAAMAHYDNVSAAVADVTVGEDAYGVWFSGRVRPWATERQIHELFAAGPSGDWRGVRSRGRDSMELVAAHAVNVQGFPVARTRFAIEGGRQVSLIAAGMPDKNKLAEANELLAEIRAAEFSMLTTTLTTLEGK